MQDHTGRQAVAAGLVLALGVVVLVGGWWVDVLALRRVLPSLESMKANTALGFVLIGVAVLPWSRARPARPVAGVALLALGVATIAQYAFGVDLGIDQVLATDPAVSASGPGRTGLVTSFAFVLVAVATVALPPDRGVDHVEARALLAQVAGLAGGLLALMNFMAYVFGAVASPGMSSSTQMALHTSVGLLVGAFALTDAAAVAGPLEPVYSTTAAGRMVRTLLPVTTLGLLVAGGVVAALGRSGVVSDPQTQLALQATLGVAAVVVVIGIVARRLDTAAREVEESRQQLLALNAELEVRVAERTAELRSAVTDLERSNAELEQFAYVASHDLQEPLRMVSSFVQRLDDRYRDELDERGREYVRLAVDGATRMSGLIDALLRYSRVGRAEIELQPVDVGDLLDDVLRTFRRRIEDEDATVAVEPPMPRLVADPTLLRQVLQNLVGNALKFTREGVPAVVRVRAEQDGDAWCIEVVDEGVGIDPRYRGEVFRMFRRLHARGSYAGTGIGLSITQRIVERHGGAITVGDPAGPHGTRIVVTLPSTREVDP